MDEFSNRQAGKSGGGPIFTGNALQDQLNAAAHAEGKRQKDNDDHYHRVNKAGQTQKLAKTGYIPANTQYRQGFLAALLSLFILPLRIIGGLCALPFFAYLGAMVITKGTRLFDDPFSGPPWYHTLGFAALGGIGIGFIIAKLIDWIEEL
jgi:hypothetical protein